MEQFASGMLDSGLVCEKISMGFTRDIEDLSIISRFHALISTSFWRCKIMYIYQHQGMTYFLNFIEYFPQYGNHFFKCILLITKLLFVIGVLLQIRRTQHPYMHSGKLSSIINHVSPSIKISGIAPPGIARIGVSQALNYRIYNFSKQSFTMGFFWVKQIFEMILENNYYV